MKTKNVIIVNLKGLSLDKIESKLNELYDEGYRVVGAAQFFADNGLILQKKW